VYGEGWQANREEVHRLLGSSDRLAVEGPREAASASACSVAFAARRRLASGELLENTLSPRYVQRADAELMMDRRATGSVPG